MKTITSCSNAQGFGILSITGIALVLMLASPRLASADFIIGGGYDLFRTTDFTYDLGGPYGLQQFKSVPIVSTDFEGDSEDEVSTGDTDTIVRRTEDSDSGNGSDNDTIEIELVELSLRSVDPIDIGAGSELIRLRFLEDLGSSMEVIYDDMYSGLFNSTLSFSFELEGLTSGLVLSPHSLTLDSTGNAWQRNANGLEIADVNSLLKGDSTTDWDFFASEEITWSDGLGNSFTVESAQPIVPEPGSLVMMATGMVGFVVGVRRRRKR